MRCYTFSSQKSQPVTQSPTANLLLPESFHFFESIHELQLFLFFLSLICFNHTLAEYYGFPCLPFPPTYLLSTTIQLYIGLLPYRLTQSTLPPFSSLVSSSRQLLRFIVCFIWDFFLNSNLKGKKKDIRLKKKVCRIYEEKTMSFG